jgi:hypothetical protein
MTDSEGPKPDNADPKIIVDSDWKEQVAKERETLEAAEAADDRATAADTAADSNDFVPQESNGDETGFPPPPPATFEILISMMFTQAMSMLGHIPDPAGAEIPVNKPYAKHTIDTLEMLGEKTKGNLTEEESAMLSEALHALRMAYVNTKA